MCAESCAALRVEQWSDNNLGSVVQISHRAARKDLGPVIVANGGALWS